jgi:uncharacterized protein (TIGR03435 family)
LILATSLASGQAAGKLEFEVASVKRNTANGPSDMRGPRRSGDSVVMHNTQLYSVIFYAYHLDGNYQMVGFTPLPDVWNWYDIEARAATSATDDQVRLMFQSLLEDRFKLKVHRETRDIPEYQLTIAKGKPKLAPSKEGPLTLTIEGRSLTQPAGRVALACGLRDRTSSVTRQAWRRLLDSSVAGWPRQSRTKPAWSGLTMWIFFYVPDERQLKPDAPPGPSLAEAMQGELGLKLEKGKGPVEVLVIDHLEKPSENW